MRIAFVSDAWHPQVNGVVTSLHDLMERLARLGHEPVLIEPSTFRTVALPGYGEIRLSLAARRQVARRLDEIAPDALHVVTEGPLGWAARAHARERGWAWSSAFHSRFPEFFAAATRLPAEWGYGWLRRFHAPADVTLVPSATSRALLESHGFAHVATCPHAVDTDVFTPAVTTCRPWRKPVFLFVGRVSAEKNLGAFLDLDLPGTKIVAGRGPLLDRLSRRHPEVTWLGAVPRERLPALYAAADVLVHPSRTDTFGLVMLEAMACGTPVAAYPVPGPLDVVGDAAAAGVGGVLHANLWTAAIRALAVPREQARARALVFSRDEVTRRFVSLMVLSRAPRRPAEPVAAAPGARAPQAAGS